MPLCTDFLSTQKLIYVNIFPQTVKDIPVGGDDAGRNKMDRQ